MVRRCVDLVIASTIRLCFGKIMKRTAKILLIIYIIISLALAIFSIRQIPIQLQNRERFVNHAFVMMIDLRKAIQEEDLEEAERLLEILNYHCYVKSMDVLEFSYFAPRGILSVKDHLPSPADRAKLAEDLTRMIELLADETGINNRKGVTYAEISGVIEDFLEKWR